MAAGAVVGQMDPLWSHGGGLQQGVQRGGVEVGHVHRRQQEPGIGITLHQPVQRQQRPLPRRWFGEGFQLRQLQCLSQGLMLRPAAQQRDRCFKLRQQQQGVLQPAAT